MKYELYDLTISLIEQRGVKIRDIAELVLISQKKYYKDLTIEEAEFNVERVLRKREVQNVIMTGIQLDKLAEEGKISSPLDKI